MRVVLVEMLDFTERGHVEAVVLFDFSEWCMGREVRHATQALGVIFQWTKLAVVARIDHRSRPSCWAARRFVP